MAHSCDVLIVGGGPAGLAAAISLRMQGSDVVVADAVKPPIDKACGEGLMPDAHRDLAALGVACDAADGASFRGIRFVNWTGAAPVSASAEFATGAGIGMRRTALHARLIDRAQEVGVRFRWKTHVALGRGVYLDNEPCRYGYLVGADGQSSRVRRWAGLERGRLTSKRFGFRSHYRIPPASNYVEVHWCALGQAYITPVAANEICVAVVTRSSATRMQQVIEAIPFLRERLAHEETFTAMRGALTTTRRLQSVAKGNVALIGDASGSVDAVTGEGLAISFRQASLLGRSLRHGSLEIYAAEHDKTLQMPRRMARVLLMLDAYTPVRNVAMRALASQPNLFQSLLQLHMGDESLRHLLLHNGSRMMKEFLSVERYLSDTEKASLHEYEIY